MMTAPSTIRPKSRAPRLIRLALIFPWSIPVAVSSIATGIRDQCRAEIAEQEEEHQDNQEGPLGQVLGYGCDRSVDEVRAVQDRLGADARRQGLVNLLDFGVGCGGHRAAVAADKHESGAEHDLFPIHARAAGPQLSADGHGGQILYAYRHAASSHNDDLADLGHGLDPPSGAHDDALAVSFDVVGASTDIVGLNSAHDVAERQTVADQLRWVRLNLILLHVPTDRVGSGYARNAFHLRTDDPVLHRAQVDGALKLIGQALAFRGQIGAVALPARLAVPPGGVLAWRCVLDRPPVDLT